MIKYWQRKKNRLPLRCTASFLLLSFIFTTLSAPFAQASIWDERGRALKRTPTQLASAKMSGAAGIGAASDAWTSGRMGTDIADIEKALLRTNENKSAVSGDFVMKALEKRRASARPGRLNGIPSELWERLSAFGSVQKVHLAQGQDLKWVNGKLQSKSPIVVHLQDVHDVYGVQRNLSFLISELVQSGAAVVGLEGSEGKLAGIETWRQYPDRESLLEVAGYLAKSGLLTGAELAGLSRADDSAEFYGLEEKQSYLDQVEAFRSTLGRKSDVQKWGKSVESVLTQLKAKAYSPSQKGLDASQSLYDAQKQNLGQRIEFLALPEYRAYSASSYPNIAKYLKTHALEKSMDFKRVSEAQKKLFVELSKKLSQEELVVLLQDSILYRLGRIGYTEFYSSLKDRCVRAGIALTPEVSQYIQYVSSVEGISQEGLFNELARLEDQAWKRTFTSPVSIQAAIHELDADYQLAKKGLDFAMSPQDYERYDARKEQIAKLNARLQEASVLVGEAVTIKEEMGRELLASVGRFNQLSHERNRIFVKNLTRKMQEGKKNFSVMVAGGYHTGGVEELLKSQNVSFITIRPKINLAEMKDGHHPLQAFIRDPLPLEKLFVQEKVTIVHPQSLGSADSFGMGRAAQTVRGLLSVLSPAVSLSKTVGTEPQEFLARFSAFTKDNGFDAVRFSNPRTQGDLFLADVAFNGSKFVVSIAIGDDAQFAQNLLNSPNELLTQMGILSDAPRALVSGQTLTAAGTNGATFAVAEYKASLAFRALSYVSSAFSSGWQSTKLALLVMGAVVSAYFADSSLDEIGVPALLRYTVLGGLALGLTYALNLLPSKLMPLRALPANGQILFSQTDSSDQSGLAGTSESYGPVGSMGGDDIDETPSEIDQVEVEEVQNFIAMLQNTRNSDTHNLNFIFTSVVAGNALLGRIEVMENAGIVLSHTLRREVERLKSFMEAITVYEHLYGLSRRPEASEGLKKAIGDWADDVRSFGYGNSWKGGIEVPENILYFVGRERDAVAALEALRAAQAYGSVNAADVESLRLGITESYAPGVHEILGRVVEVGEPVVLQEGSALDPAARQVVDETLASAIHANTLAAFDAWRYSAVASPVGKFGDKVGTRAFVRWLNAMGLVSGTQAAEGARDNAATTAGLYGIEALLSQDARQPDLLFANDPVEVTERLQKENYLGSVTIISYAIRKLYAAFGAEFPNLNLPDKVYMLGVMGPKGSGVDISYSVGENMVLAALSKNRDIRQLRVTGVLARERHMDIMNEIFKVLGVKLSDIDENLRKYFVETDGSIRFADRSQVTAFSKHVKSNMGGQALFHNAVGGSIKMVTDGDLMPVMEILKGSADMAIGAGGVAEAMIKTRMGYEYIDFSGRVISNAKTKEGLADAVQALDTNARYLTDEEIGLARGAGLEIASDEKGSFVAQQFNLDSLTGGPFSLSVIASPLGNQNTGMNNYVPELRSVEILDGGNRIRMEVLVVEPLGRAYVIPVTYETGLSDLLSVAEDERLPVGARAESYLYAARVYGDLKLYDQAESIFSELRTIAANQNDSELRQSVNAMNAFYEGMKELLVNPQSDKEVAKSHFENAKALGHAQAQYMLEVIESGEPKTQAPGISDFVDAAAKATGADHAAALENLYGALRKAGQDQLQDVLLLARSLVNRVNASSSDLSRSIFNRIRSSIRANSSLGWIAEETLPALELEKRKSIPGHADVKPGELYLGKYDKIYPVTLAFLNSYGGSKGDYAVLRDLAGVLENTSVRVGQTNDPYIDVNRDLGQITINEDFLDFLFKTGRKKIFMSLMAGALLRMRNGLDADTTGLEILVTGKKTSLVSGLGITGLLTGKTSRLSDTQRLYTLQKDVQFNDTRDGSGKRKFLNNDDVTLVIADLLQRGKIVDQRRLRSYLRKEFGYYGEISEERAQRLLDRFQRRHSDIVDRKISTPKEETENLRKKLSDDARIVEAGGEQAEKKPVITFSLKPGYVSDPAFTDRWTVWDVEVERQDEVDFGGKSAHTGEMMFVPGVVTLPNFFSHGKTFQRLFDYNTMDVFSSQVSRQIQSLENFIARHRAALTVPASQLPEKLEHEINALRIVVDEAQDGPVVAAQLNETVRILKGIQTKITNFRQEAANSGKTDPTLRDYFTSVGNNLDMAVGEIRREKIAVDAQLAQLRKDLKEKEEQKDAEAQASITSKMHELENRLAENQKEYEQITAETANTLLVAGRNLVVPPDLAAEIKANLRALAVRIGIPLDKLVEAIRSSAVGEDSEEASFAGRQDTYIFQTPVATERDPEGLDNIIVSWVFNQSSLFNKRAIDYRTDHGIATFDEHAEVSTLFQQMFLSELSFISFSVDRETGYPAISISITEGQGELLVSGQESGSKYILSYDGTLLVRDRGDRKQMVVETADGLGKVRRGIPDEVRREYSVTDRSVLERSTAYFKGLHDYYESYVDMEGAYRRKRDANGNIIYLKDANGNVLRDERGFPRADWTIASTQVRPETVFSTQDPDEIKLQRIVVTESAFEKAVRLGRVLAYEFIAKTGGTAQGAVVYIRNKLPESLAKAFGKIMIAEQSDPDMNSAMIAAKGIGAIKGGPNSHTMIVAAEYNLVAMTGIPGNMTLEQLSRELPEDTEITLDAERGKFILGTEHELEVAGNNFNVRDIPNSDPKQVRSATIVATVEKAFKQWALSKVPTYKGIGLERLEIALAKIGIYPELLLAYDNTVKQRNGQPFEGPVFDMSKYEDAQDFNFVRDSIGGYNSAEDFYVSILSEWLQATAETLNAPKDEVVVRAQKIRNPKLRLQVLGLIDANYAAGLGEERPLYNLKAIHDHVSLRKGDRKLLEEIIGLMDKRVYIRLDDRKSDEYKNVRGADRFIEEETNPMKGLRGLDLLLATPLTTRWQLEAIRRVAETRRAKLAVFAPVVRRPEDLRRLLEMMDEAGVTKDMVKRGIMTEIPTNSINIEDFMMVFVERNEDGFISTGGNDGLQTVAKIDRNANQNFLKQAVTAYNPSVLRWNARIVKVVGDVNRAFNRAIDTGFCGNDPSVKGQENYGNILKRMGYRSVSVVIEAYEKVASNLTKDDFEIPAAAEEAIGFDFDMDPSAPASPIDYEQISIADIRMGLGVHHLALKDYDDGVLREKNPELYQSVRGLLVRNGYENPDLPGIGRQYYYDVLSAAIVGAARKARTEGRRLVVGTDDGLSTSYRALLGGDVYELQEANPDYGVHGVVKGLFVDREFLETDLSIINTLHDSNPNIEIALKTVRNYKDLEVLTEMMERLGIITPARKAGEIAVGLDVQVAANLFEIKEILNPAFKLAFVSVANPVQLTSELMALEQGNANGAAITAGDVSYQMRRPVMILATAAQKAGVPFYLGANPLDSASPIERGVSGAETVPSLSNESEAETARVLALAADHRSGELGTHQAAILTSIAADFKAQTGLDMTSYDVYQGPSGRNRNGTEIVAARNKSKRVSISYIVKNTHQTMSPAQEQERSVRAGELGWGPRVLLTVAPQTGARQALIVEEYIDEINSFPYRLGRLKASEKKSVAEKLADMLYGMHDLSLQNGVTHKFDDMPAHLMLVGKGSDIRPVFIDWGLSSVVTASNRAEKLSTAIGFLANVYHSDAQSFAWTIARLRSLAAERSSKDLSAYNQAIADARSTLESIPNGVGTRSREFFAEADKLLTKGSGKGLLARLEGGWVLANHILVSFHSAFILSFVHALLFLPDDIHGSNHILKHIFINPEQLFTFGLFFLTYWVGVWWHERGHYWESVKLLTLKKEALDLAQENRSGLKRLVWEAKLFVMAPSGRFPGVKKEGLGYYVESPFNLAVAAAGPKASARMAKFALPAAAVFFLLSMVDRSLGLFGSLGSLSAGYFLFGAGRLFFGVGAVGMLDRLFADKGRVKELQERERKAREAREGTAQAAPAGSWMERVGSVKRQLSNTRLQEVTLSDGTRLRAPWGFRNSAMGGEHTKAQYPESNISLQEGMFIPLSAKNYEEAQEMTVRLQNRLLELINGTEGTRFMGIGLEGGLSAYITPEEGDKIPEQRLWRMMKQAIEDSGYVPGVDVVLALDPATSELQNAYREKMDQEDAVGQYYFYRDPSRDVVLSRDELLDIYVGAMEAGIPIVSIEDPFAEDDLEGWKMIIDKLGKDIFVIGDDLVTTNDRVIEDRRDLINAQLTKANQIGTVSETISAMLVAIGRGIDLVISHRSQSPNDPFEAYLALAYGAAGLKAGGGANTERLVKYQAVLETMKEAMERTDSGDAVGETHDYTVKGVTAYETPTNSGNPTVKVKVSVDGHQPFEGATPLGTSAGTGEAIHLLDSVIEPNDVTRRHADLFERQKGGDGVVLGFRKEVTDAAIASLNDAELTALWKRANRYKGKGVQNAVGYVDSVISRLFVGKKVSEIGSIVDIDNQLLALELQTARERGKDLSDPIGLVQRKQNLGMNAILATSLAMARLKAQAEGKELWQIYREPGAKAMASIIAELKGKMDDEESLHRSGIETQYADLDEFEQLKKEFAWTVRELLPEGERLDDLVRRHLGLYANLDGAAAQTAPAPRGDSFNAFALLPVSLMLAVFSPTWGLILGGVTVLSGLVLGRGKIAAAYNKVSTAVSGQTGISRKAAALLAAIAAVVPMVAWQDTRAEGPSGTTATTSNQTANLPFRLFVPQLAADSVQQVPIPSFQTEDDFRAWVTLNPAHGVRAAVQSGYSLDWTVVRKDAASEELATRIFAGAAASSPADILAALDNGNENQDYTEDHHSHGTHGFYTVERGLARLYLINPALAQSVLRYMGDNPKAKLRYTNRTLGESLTLMWMDVLLAETDLDPNTILNQQELVEWLMNSLGDERLANLLASYYATYPGQKGNAHLQGSTIFGSLPPALKGRVQKVLTQAEAMSSGAIVFLHAGINPFTIVLGWLSRRPADGYLKADGSTDWRLLGSDFRSLFSRLFAPRKTAFADGPKSLPGITAPSAEELRGLLNQLRNLEFTAEWSQDFENLYAWLAIHSRMRNDIQFTSGREQALLLQELWGAYNILNIYRTLLKASRNRVADDSIVVKLDGLGRRIVKERFNELWWNSGYDQLDALRGFITVDGRSDSHHDLEIFQNAERRLIVEDTGAIIAGFDDVNVTAEAKVAKLIALQMILSRMMLVPSKDLVPEVGLDVLLALDRLESSSDFTSLLGSNPALKYVTDRIISGIRADIGDYLRAQASSRDSATILAHSALVSDPSTEQLMAAAANSAAIPGNAYAEIGFEGRFNRLGWVRPPSEADVMLYASQIDDMLAGMENVIFIGMGGSINSVKAFKGIMGDRRIVVDALDSLDPSALAKSLAGKDLQKTLIVTISKSATTAETLGLTGIFKTAFGDEWKNHILILTDPENTAKLPENYRGAQTMAIQVDGGNGIGGRFTAPLTGTWILPAYLFMGDAFGDVYKSFLERHELAAWNAVQGARELHYSGAQRFAVIVEDEKVRDAMNTWIIQLFQESLGSKIEGFYPRTLVVAKGDSIPEGFTPLNLEVNSDDIQSRTMLLQYGLERFVAELALLKGLNFVTQEGVEVYKAETRRLVNEGGILPDPKRVNTAQLLSEVLSAVNQKRKSFVDFVLYGDYGQAELDALRAQAEAALPKGVGVQVFIGSDWNHHSYQAAKDDPNTLFVILQKPNYEIPQGPVFEASSDVLNDNVKTLRIIARATYNTLSDKALFYALDNGGNRGFFARAKSQISRFGGSASAAFAAISSAVLRLFQSRKANAGSWTSRSAELQSVVLGLRDGKASPKSVESILASAAADLNKAQSFKGNAAEAQALGEISGLLLALQSGKADGSVRAAIQKFFETEAAVLFEPTRLLSQLEARKVRFDLDSSAGSKAFGRVRSLFGSASNQETVASYQEGVVRGMGLAAYASLPAGSRYGAARKVSDLSKTGTRMIDVSDVTRGRLSRDARNQIGVVERTLNELDLDADASAQGVALVANSQAALNALRSQITNSKLNRAILSGRVLLIQDRDAAGRIRLDRVVSQLPAAWTQAIELLTSNEDRFVDSFTLKITILKLLSETSVKEVQSLKAITDEIRQSAIIQMQA